MSDILRSYHSILETANVLRSKEATRLCIGFPPLLAEPDFVSSRMDRGVGVLTKEKIAIRAGVAPQFSPISFCTATGTQKTQTQIDLWNLVS